MAYDAATSKVVLFGGSSGNGVLGDTWTWDGSTWTQQSPTTSPPADYTGSMAYDPATGQLVLFGGTPLLNQTWTYGYSPSITTQPSSQSVVRGGSLTFTAAATGSPIPTVQWQLSVDGGHNWFDIQGATSTTFTTGTLASFVSGWQVRAVYTNSLGQPRRLLPRSQ